LGRFGDCRFRPILRLRHGAWRSAIPGDRAHHADLGRIFDHRDFDPTGSAIRALGGMAICFLNPGDWPSAGSNGNATFARPAGSVEDCARTSIIMAKKESPPELKQRTRAIVRTLKRAYPDAKCSLNHSNAFELLITTILSAQCTDARVNIVTQDLF